MTFSTPPEAFPNSAEYEFVITWNSWIQSCDSVDAWAPDSCDWFDMPSTNTLFWYPR